MKVIQVFITIGIITVSLVGCKNSTGQQSTSEEDQVKEMLTTFYISYIRMKSGVDFDKSDSLLNLYCSKKQLNHLNSLNQQPPGSVPGDTANEFLKTQMYDSQMSATDLNVKKDESKNNCYYVTYKYGSRPVTIKLNVIKEGDHFKIDHVFIPGFDE